MNQALHEVQCQRLHQDASYSHIVHSKPDIREEPSVKKTVVVKEDFKSNAKIVSCPGCGKKVSENDLKKHQATECQDKLIPCEFCGETFPIELFSQHEELCTRNPSNQGTSLENVKIPCEFCRRSISGDAYERHLRDCPQRQREEAQSHLPDEHRRNQRENPFAGLSRDCEDEEDENLFAQHIPSNRPQNTSNNSPRLSNNFLDTRIQQNINMGMPTMGTSMFQDRKSVV